MERERLICWDPKSLQEAYNFLAKSPLKCTDIETIPFKKLTKKQQKAYFDLVGVDPNSAKGPKPPPRLTVISYSGFNEDSTKIHSYLLPFVTQKDRYADVPLHFEEIFKTAIAINDLPNPTTLQNGVYDCSWFLWMGMPLRNYAYDSMTLWWSIYPDLPRRLDYITSVLLTDYVYWKANRKAEDFIDYCNYAMDDTESTLRATVKLIQMACNDERIMRNFYHAHLRCLASLEMSAAGMAVDESVMDEIRKTLDVKAVKALERLRYIVADSEFNPNSAPQKKNLIYSILNAKPRGPKGKFVKRIEDASTGAIALRAMRSDHPIFRRVIDATLDAIAPAKQISNVVGLARFPGGSTGSRFVTTYDGVATTTSRLGSRGNALGFGGNAQNIRKDYRRFARADVGHFLLEIDLSASDDVFVAFESAEPKKIDLVRSGKDAHATNALIFFPNWTYDGIVAGKKAKDDRVVHPITGVRQITKKVVHGTHYLMAGLTLLMSAGREAIVAAAKELGYEDANFWTQEKLVAFCDMLSHKFRVHYPRFQLEHDSPDSWYRDLRREVVTTGGFTTPFEYFQRFSSDPRDDATLRAVAATAGQAGTAGRINMVMEELFHGIIPKRFRDGPNPHRDARPLQVSPSLNGVSTRLQTHDSLTFDVNPMHPGWFQGMLDVFESFSRPVIIKGETVVVGIEADVSIWWAGKETFGIHTPHDLLTPIKGDPDGLNWLQKMSLSYVDPVLA